MTRASSPTSSRRSKGPGTPAQVLAACGLAVLIAAPVWLLLTDHTSLRISADEGAPPVSLWGVVLPAVTGIVLARAIPPRMNTIDPLSAARRAQVRRETWVAAAMAVAFPAVIAALPAEASRGPWYAVLKVVLFLLVPLVAFRLLRGTGPGCRAIPVRVPRLRWLAPLPAIVVWFYLSQVSALAPPPTPAAALPDPVTLAVVSVVTLLTASVLEEIFYRGFLQTRLETLIGRWPAIAASSLLFAGMHLPTHGQPGAVATGLATVLTFHGLFGVLCGYLWSRYRNIWIPITVHAITNLVYVDLILNWLGR